jgi:hypothetical protein
VSAVSNVASSVLGAAKSLLHIGSPSKVFADEVGAMIPAGIAQGIDAAHGLINSALASALNPGTLNLKATASVTASALNFPQQIVSSLANTGQTSPLTGISASSPAAPTSTQTAPGGGGDLVLQLDGTTLARLAGPAIQTWLLQRQRVTPLGINVS